MPSAAVDAFRHVTEIDPNDADTWYFLGSTYAQLKQFPEAIAAFASALKIDPLHASAEFGLARAYQQSGQADPAHEAMKKFQYITQNKLGAPISLAYGEQGKYSRAEESPVAPEKVRAAIPVRFVDVTAEAGIAPTLGAQRGGSPASLFAPGACFLDYDGDGQIDLFLPDNGTQGGMSLYHNLGNGKFENVTKKAGLERFAEGFSCTAGDYDNDGFTDLAVVLRDRILLLHNEKDGTFKDVTQQAGLATGAPTSKQVVAKLPGAPLAGPAEALGVTFIDYDHDGDLDLYVTKLAPVRLKGTSENVWSETLPPVGGNMMWRNNGNGTFTAAPEVGMVGNTGSIAALGTDYNNDRAVDVVLTGGPKGATIFENPREGMFKVQELWPDRGPERATGVAVLDFDHDGWMDLAFTHSTDPGLTLWRNNHGKRFEHVDFPSPNWVRAYGIAAIDYDNDGWVDLVAVGETKDGKGEVRLFRNLGPDGFKDVTAETGLDKIQLQEPRAIIAGDYDNDGAVDLVITQNHGPAVLLHNEGGNKNNSLRLALRGLNDNKSAIGTKVEVFSAGLRQKFEVYGSSGYLGQNSPYLTIGLGQANEADVVRMLWPTGVLQDEIGVAANKRQDFLEMDRRGSSCPTLFAWDGHKYQLVGDMLGAGVVGHWIAAGDSKAGRNVVRNIARPTESIKLDRNSLREKDGRLSFRFMEPLEESVFLDQVKLLAVDHPADVDVYPNEYFASNPPYPPFKVVFSNKKDARPPAGAWDEHGHNVLPDLLAHRYFGDFKVLSFMGFTEPHSLELDLGEPYRGGPLWLLLHGEIEYFSATSMYAADQAHLRPFAPYVEAEDVRFGEAQRFSAAISQVSGSAALAAEGESAKGRWVRVIDDMGFPAGGARTMTADLTGKLPPGTRRIRITTNLQIYWDNILISRVSQETSQDSIHDQRARLTQVPLAARRPEFPRLPAEDRRPAARQCEIHLRKGQRHRSIHAASRRLHALWRCTIASRLDRRQICRLWIGR